MQNTPRGRVASAFPKFLFTITAIALGIGLSSVPAAAQYPPRERSEPPEQSEPQERYAAPDQTVPPELTLQPGTVISVRVNDWLSSDRNRAGDEFGGVLEQPLVAGGWVVAYAGQPVIGRVAVAQRAGRVKGVSQLGVELSELTLADGQVVQLRTQLLQSSAGASRGRDAATVVGTTGLGAAIGAIAGGGRGAGIGAGAGAAAGVVGVLATPGRETVIPAEALLTFRVESPVAFSTERSQTAFYPVTPESYRTGAPRSNYRRQQYGAPPDREYYPPPVVYRRYRAPYYYSDYPYGYYQPYGYYYRPYGYRSYYRGSYYRGPSFVFRFGSHRHGHRHYRRH